MAPFTYSHSTWKEGKAVTYVNTPKKWLHKYAACLLEQVVSKDRPPIQGRSHLSRTAFSLCDYLRLSFPLCLLCGPFYYISHKELPQKEEKFKYIGLNPSQRQGGQATFFKRKSFHVTDPSSCDWGI